MFKSVKNYMYVSFLLDYKMTEQMFQLEQDEELRIEVDCPKGEKVTVELMSGIAEIFGTEMVTNTKYKFGSGTKLAVFTYQGCSIKVREKPCPFKI